MKRLTALLLMALMIFGAAAEVPAPPRPVDDPEGVAAAALPLLELLCACPSFASFDGAPPAALAREVRDNLPFFFEGDCPDDVLDRLFLACEPLPEAMPSTAPFIPTQVEIDSVLDTGTGSVRVYAFTRQDFGDGFEFSFAAEFVLLPADDALFGARVVRVFIPE